MWSPRATPILQLQSKRGLNRKALLEASSTSWILKPGLSPRHWNLPAISRRFTKMQEAESCQVGHTATALSEEEHLNIRRRGQRKRKSQMLSVGVRACTPACRCPALPLNADQAFTNPFYHSASLVHQPTSKTQPPFCSGMCFRKLNLTAESGPNPPWH